MKTITVDTLRGSRTRCPFWTADLRTRNCRAEPPGVESGCCFGAIPVWCPLPVLVRRKTDDEDAAAQPSAKEKGESVNVAEYLNGRSVMIRAYADEEQRLFNSIGQEEIVVAIKQEHSIHLSPDQILMGWPIRELGVFDVSLRLKGTPTIKVWIVQGVQPERPKPDEPKEDSGLLPCPFCGYNGVKINVTVVLPTLYWGECKSCHALGPKRVIESEAPTAWNQRAKAASRTAPEEPKVESLREAAERLRNQEYRDWGSHAIADLCALVLRRHLALLKLFVAHVTEPVSSETDVRRWARWECDQVDQMLEGSE